MAGRAAYLLAVLRSRAPAPAMISGLTAAAVLALVVAERHRPLRTPGEGWFGHNGRNLAAAALSALAVNLLERPITRPLARSVERRRLGLIQRLPVPPWARDTLAVLLMDYSLYAWHVLTHRSPLLWRFHRVHHADLDLSASTALRFHFGEMIASAPWRAAQILLIGTSPRALDAWRRLLFLSIVFHHSDWRLPEPVERRLRWLVMTPRLHGIHHAADRAWSNSNWSSGLTLWDRLHGTLKADRPQPREIGVAELRRPEQVAFRRLVAMPFSPTA